MVLLQQLFIPQIKKEIKMLLDDDKKSSKTKGSTLAVHAINLATSIMLGAVQARDKLGFEMLDTLGKYMDNLKVDWIAYDPNLIAGVIASTVIATINSGFRNPVRATEGLIIIYSGLLANMCSASNPRDTLLSTAALSCMALLVKSISNHKKNQTDGGLEIS